MSIKNNKAPQTIIADLAVVAISIMGPMLGGSVQFEIKVLMAALCSFVLLLDPPRRLPSGAMMFLVSVFLLLAMASFLPSDWFGAFPARDTFSNVLGMSFAPTLSMQPWKTLETVSTLVIFLCWGIYLLYRDWMLTRRQIFGIYVTGLALGTLIALAEPLTGWRPSLWPTVEGLFSFFPNRNQTSNVLSLGCLMTMALVWHELRERKTKRWMGLWILILGILATGLIMSYSRAGIILFFFGLATGVGWISRGFKKQAYLGGGLAVFCAAIVLFLVLGGETLERFIPRSGGEQHGLMDFRLLIFTDAIKMAMDGPLIGVGLGNFDGVFALYRSASVSEGRAIHPESDWLWLLCEMGWFAPMLLFGICCLVLKECVFSEKLTKVLQVAPLVCVFLFILHGFFDVSGHRLGSVLPILFFLGMAARKDGVASGHHARQRDTAILSVKSGRKGQWSMVNGIRTHLNGPFVFRAAAVAMGIIVAFWVASLLGHPVFPNSYTILKVKAQVDEAIKKRDFNGCIWLAGHAIRLTPLDWSLYFHRGSSLAILNRDEEALLDFRRARRLEPMHRQIYMSESRIWLAKGNFFQTLETWKAALKIVPASDHSLFEQIVSSAVGSAPLMGEIREWVGASHRRWLVYYRLAPPEVLNNELNKQLSREPIWADWPIESQREAFALWHARGDRRLLANALAANPKWIPAAWQWRAEFLAAEGKHREALELVKRIGKVQLPRHREPTSSRSAIEVRYRLHPHDPVVVLEYYELLRQEGDRDAAMNVLEKFSKLPEVFSVVQLFLWEEYAARGEWKKAWEAFVKTTRP